jgi:hypothetical protein
MCLGCERGRFDVSNPDVMEFVKQLKNGTYDQYEWTEEGDRLWTIMPAFQKKTYLHLSAWQKIPNWFLPVTTSL